jgi:hypothetical protein
LEKGLMTRGFVMVLLVVAGGAGTTDLRDWPLAEQCDSARYVVVGRLHLISTPPEVEDDGTLRFEWAGGRLEVDESLAGRAPEALRVLWIACCREELQAIQLTGLNSGVLQGVWLLFPESEGVNAVWHPMSSLAAIENALKSDRSKHE